MQRTSLKPYPTVTTKEVYETANEPNTKASTTITILATTTIVVATIDVVGSLAVTVIIACAASTSNRTTMSISSEEITYLIR